jgi:4-hydroxy-tetrahydrodipicolinate synthase
MMKLEGVIAATPTPLKADFSIDLERLVTHCRWLLGEGGCDGVNLLGTTGEAMSFSAAQRIQVMRAVAVSGVPLERMMVGTGAAALQDAAQLTAAARELGFAGALVVPPFYYRDVPADSVAAYFEELIARVGVSKPRIYLYHIPQNTGVPFALETIARLRAKHPDVVVGLKDSAGDIAYSRKVAAELPGFDVFPGSEGTLIEAKQSGFRGCISATTNVTGRLAQVSWREPTTDAGRAASKRALEIRTALARFSLVASVKGALALMKGDREWGRTHPPMAALRDPGLAAVKEAISGL